MTNEPPFFFLQNAVQARLTLSFSTIIWSFDITSHCLIKPLYHYDQQIIQNIKMHSPFFFPLLWILIILVPTLHRIRLCSWVSQSQDKPGKMGRFFFFKSPNYAKEKSWHKFTSFMKEAESFLSRSDSFIKQRVSMKTWELLLLGHNPHMPQKWCRSLQSGFFGSYLAASVSQSFWQSHGQRLLRSEDQSLQTPTSHGGLLG